MQVKANSSEEVIFVYGAICDAAVFDGAMIDVALPRVGCA